MKKNLSKKNKKIFKFKINNKNKLIFDSNFIIKILYK